MSLAESNGAPSHNGTANGPVVATANTTAADLLFLLEQVTPAQVVKMREDLDAKFAQQKQEYQQQSKMLAMLERSMSAKRPKGEKPDRLTADERQADQERIVELVWQHKKPISNAELAEQLGIAKNAAALKANALVRMGRLKRDGAGKLMPGKK